MCNCFFCLGSPCNGGLKAKSLRVTSFKGGIQNSESGASALGKKVSINSVKLSYRSDDVVNNVDTKHIRFIYLVNRGFNHRTTCYSAAVQEMVNTVAQTVTYSSDSRGCGRTTDDKARNWNRAIHFGPGFGV